VPSLCSEENVETLFGVHEMEPGRLRAGLQVLLTLITRIVARDDVGTDRLKCRNRALIVHRCSRRYSAGSERGANDADTKEQALHTIPRIEVAQCPAGTRTPLPEAVLQDGLPSSYHTWTRPRRQTRVPFLAGLTRALSISDHGLEGRYATIVRSAWRPAGPTCAGMIFGIRGPRASQVLRGSPGVETDANRLSPTARAPRTGEWDDEERPAWTRNMNRNEVTPLRSWRLRSSVGVDGRALTESSHLAEIHV
jgi:hypothetical protein